MTSIILALALAQFTTTGQPIKVNCVNCSGGPGGAGWVPDGGNVGYMRMPDAGALEVYVSNPGGPASAVNQGVGYDGGGTWGVWIEGGNLTVSGGAGWFPDGGSIGTVGVENFPASYPVTDNGGSLTVDGTVAVSSVAGSVAVTGTFWQATQPVSGTLTCNAGSGPFPISDNGGSITVDGTFWQATQPVSGTVTCNAGSGPFPVSDNSGSLTVDGTLTCNAGTGPWPVTDNGGSLTVDGTVAISGTVAVTDNAGSLTVDGTVTANAGTGTFTVGGVAAHAATVSGNPQQIGAYVDEGALDSTNVAEGDITRLKADIEGRLLVETAHPNQWSPSSGLSTATTLTQIQAAPGAGLSLYITGWVMSASVASTTTTDQQLTLKYGTGTNCGTGTTYVSGCFNQANGGCAVSLENHIKLPANNALCWIHAAAGSKIVTVFGYTAP